MNDGSEKIIKKPVVARSRYYLEICSAVRETTSLRISNVPAAIRTQRLPNTNLKHHSNKSFRGVTVQATVQWHRDKVALNLQF
jgi:hypothetical protein